MIIQEFESILWEWRVIKVGPSFFGFKKLLKGSYASGSLRFGWVPPPRELLELLDRVCERGNFFSMAMDVFETEDGRFLINELQSIFGSTNESQMYIDGVPGRYVREGGDYVFEEGVFNMHKSYPLRVAHFVEILKARGDVSPGTGTPNPT